MLEEGASYSAIARSERSAFIRYYKGIAEAIRVAQGPSGEFTRKRVLILVGPTGCGKTRCATSPSRCRRDLRSRTFIRCTKRLMKFNRSLGYELAKSMGTRVARPICKKDQVWFENYDPVETDVVLLDDFRGETSLAYMLQLLDGYELSVERKGASVLFKPKVIVITSNDEPDRWWPGKDLAPFWRRVNEGGGSYCLWVERPRIQSANGRVTQEGGLVRTYPQGGASLPDIATASVAGASAPAAAIRVRSMQFYTPCRVSRCPG